jgi:excisionase family DNA binding protein
MEEKIAVVLTADEAAALLRVSTKTILALARDGTLPGEKVGRAWRFVREDLLDYVRGEKRDRPGAVAS